MLDKVLLIFYRVKWKLNISFFFKHIPAVLMAFQERVFIKNPFVLSKDIECVIVLFKITTVPYI